MTEIERQIAGWFGGKTPLTAPLITMPEEYIGIAGHLLLAGSGAAYALVWRRDRSVIVNGLVFGAALTVPRSFRDEYKQLLRVVSGDTAGRSQSARNAS